MQNLFAQFNLIPTFRGFSMERELFECLIETFFADQLQDDIPFVLTLDGATLGIECDVPVESDLCRFNDLSDASRLEQLVHLMFTDVIRFQYSVEEDTIEIVTK